MPVSTDMFSYTVSQSDKVNLEFMKDIAAEDLVGAFALLRAKSAGEKIAAIVDDLPDQDFSECLPSSVLRHMAQKRKQVVPSVYFIRSQPLRLVDR